MRMPSYLGVPVRAVPCYIGAMCVVQLLPGVTDLLASSCGAIGYLEVRHLPSAMMWTEPAAFLLGPVDLASIAALCRLCGLRCSIGPALGQDWAVSHAVGGRGDEVAAARALASIEDHGSYVGDVILLRDDRHVYLAEPRLGNFTLSGWMRAELGRYGLSFRPDPLPISRMS